MSKLNRNVNSGYYGIQKKKKKKVLFNLLKEVLNFVKLMTLNDVLKQDVHIAYTSSQSKHL